MGLHLQESIAEQGALRDATDDEIDASLERLNRWNGNRNGEDPVEIRKALQECMQHNFSVFREGDAMAKGLEQLKAIRERLKNAPSGRHLQRVQHPAASSAWSWIT
ncbi:succinate dehydrogenase flavoprotein subunit [Enterobacter asburiae]|uniref:Succinate dehydrogenase flavoprotein subunit n=1 Tax=Enterobacter asburiae TaxID=61645 RepID=A0A376F429_ENTAS|nr:succinate dehydrogenase flavoprotein subunit [Enterobacter asburiae]